MGTRATNWVKSQFCSAVLPRVRFPSGSMAAVDSASQPPIPRTSDGFPGPLPDLGCFQEHVLHISAFTGRMDLSYLTHHPPGLSSLGRQAFSSWPLCDCIFCGVYGAYFFCTLNFGSAKWMCHFFVLASDALCGCVSVVVFCALHLSSSYFSDFYFLGFLITLNVLPLQKWLHYLEFFCISVTSVRVIIRQEACLNVHHNRVCSFTVHSQVWCHGSTWLLIGPRESTPQDGRSPLKRRSRQKC